MKLVFNDVYEIKNTSMGWVLLCVYRGQTNQTYTTGEGHLFRIGAKLGTQSDQGWGDMYNPSVDFYDRHYIKIKRIGDMSDYPEYFL